MWLLLADAVVDPWAVMVKTLHTFLADEAVPRLRGAEELTLRA